jgi:choline dehydrogenase
MLRRAWPPSRSTSLARRRTTTGTFSNSEGQARTHTTQFYLLHLTRYLVNFRGYFPGYSINATNHHNVFTWAILKAHPRNNAGTVKLRSADPLDVPEIVYNYFDTGNGNYSADLQALYEAVELARDAFDRQLIPVTEVLPGKDVQTPEQIKAFAQDTAWGHHASCTCPIGADSDPMAVLDSSFRVRGVSGLRVVDASVYPRIPGTFTSVSTMMVAEKAADVILSQRKKI